jgi:hypothetical protein
MYKLELCFFKRFINGYNRVSSFKDYRKVKIGLIIKFPHFISPKYRILYFCHFYSSEYSVDNTVIRELIKTESYTGNSATPEPVKEENKSNSDLDLKKVPNEFKNCRGCGAPFQLVNKHFAGYIDKTVLLKSIEQISLISSLKDESKEIREKIGIFLFFFFFYEFSLRIFFFFL